MKLDPRLSKLTSEHLEQIKRNIPNDKGLHRKIDAILEARRKEISMTFRFRTSSTLKPVTLRNVRSLRVREDGLSGILRFHLHDGSKRYYKVSEVSRMSLLKPRRKAMKTE